MENSQEFSRVLTQEHDTTQEFARSLAKVKAKARGPAKAKAHAPAQAKG